MKSKLLCLVVIAVQIVFGSTPRVKNVKAMQQCPWGKVYISYEVEGGIVKEDDLFIGVFAEDKASGRIYEAKYEYLSGDTGMYDGLHKIIWDIDAQGIVLHSAHVVFTVMYSDELYLVIDLSAGANALSYPISYRLGAPTDGWTDEYKTTKMALRRISSGSFRMGGLYNVMLTKPFYMGVFEVTQKQYELVMSSNPSQYKGDKRPVEKVSYDMIRGSSNGAKWPTSSSVDSSSFLGKFRARTGLNFDLPTEAQWEYACRAGTTSDYNNGGNSESDLKKLGRYSGNKSDGKGGYSDAHTTVGSYMPNAWGLYDMHGNGFEWCLDWFGDLSNNVIDPKGPSSSHARVFRGGGWFYSADKCISSQRDLYYSGGVSYYDYRFGFRLCLVN